MTSKNLTIRLHPNALILESPNTSDKQEFELWNKIKCTVLKVMIGDRGKKLAFVMNPCEEESYYYELGAPCTQCPAPNSNCYMLTPDVWSSEVIEDLGSNMSFELGQLWFIDRPAALEYTNNAEFVDILMTTINECSGVNSIDINTAPMELIGCVADGAWIAWYIPKAKEVEKTLKNALEETIAAAPVNWNVIVTPECR